MDLMQCCAKGSLNLNNDRWSSQRLPGLKSDIRFFPKGPQLLRCLCDMTQDHLYMKYSSNELDPQNVKSPNSLNPIDISIID